MIADVLILEWSFRREGKRYEGKECAVLVTLEKN